MDASDVIRKLQTQTRYNYLLTSLVTQQPKANISSCTSEGNLKINYKDFSQRDDLALGKYYANTCSTTSVAYIVNSFMR